uniref:Peptidase A2 domain-containing protein n=2 Tax=Lutzomyia longipalpis TaxID=7200 RepID=A0A1B0CQ10_LUTLO
MELEDFIGTNEGAQGGETEEANPCTTEDTSKEPTLTEATFFLPKEADKEKFIAQKSNDDFFKGFLDYWKSQNPPQRVSPAQHATEQNFNLPGPALQPNPWKFPAWDSAYPNRSSNIPASDPFAFPHHDEYPNRAGNNQGWNIQRPKLPPLKVPKFSGKTKDWKSFYEIFKHVIHDDPYLHTTEKFSYLLSYLEGDAKRVVGHLSPVGDHYRDAISLLKDRYENKRDISMNYFNMLMDLRKADFRSPFHLIEIHDRVNEAMAGLKSLEYRTEHWDLPVMAICIRKLDSESLRLFEESLVDPLEVPRISEFTSFLRRRYRVLTTTRSLDAQPKKTVKDNKGERDRKESLPRNSYHAVSNKVSCLLCKEPHVLIKCPKFVELSPTKRHEQAVKLDVCIKCLSHKKNKQCTSKKVCTKCSKASHHSMLHFEKKTDESQETQETSAYLVSTDQNQEEVVDSVTLHSHAKKGSPLFPTIMLKAKAQDGTWHLLRALLDTGSGDCFITEKAAQQLCLMREKISAPIKGIGGNSAGTSRHQVNINLSPRFSSNFKITVQALVLSNLTGDLPQMEMNEAAVEGFNFNNVILADPTFMSRGPIDMILSSEIYAAIVKDGMQKFKSLTSQKTEFGWILAGSHSQGSTPQRSVISMITLSEIDQKLQQFWEMDHLEEVPDPSHPCEEHFRQTHQRDKDGRYIVSLPFKKDTSTLGDSRNQALARLINLEKKLAKNADLKNQYSQFMNLQRILWRENQWEDVKEYTLNTVTYGTACATFLSVKVIQQLAIDEGHHFPKAKAAMKDFYVDDVLTGAHSLQEAREVRDQLIGLMSRGGMNLRKWTASDPRLLEDLPQNQIESKYLNLTDDEVLKALGVGWNPITDKIQYTVRAPTAGQLTKRKILSDVAAIFDPIGLLAPIMIAAKMFVQRLWKEKLDWDDPIPSIIADEWNTFLHNLPDIGKIEIERFFGYEPGSNVQLHGFADASEKGFGAVIYVRVSTRETTKVTILTAKTRVTPLKKKISLPRLELCGGVLLAELMDNTEKALQIPGIEKHAWLDSKIALAWIAKDAANWETYIANRVEKIHQLVNRNVWKHVESAQNPADIASRGICPSQLSQNALWWNGPSWLSRNEREWPVNENDTPPAKAEDRENSCTTTNKKEEDDQRNVMGHQAVCALSTEGGDKAVQNPLTMKYDSLNKAIRITAYCKRFLQLCRGEKPETPHLSNVWKRWVKEYLHHLQERNKWKKRTQPIKTGELVLIMDDNTAPLQWPLARVEHVLPDKAGLPRVADLRTATGTKRRPITKIARLPIHQEDNPIEEAPVDALPWDRLTLLTRFIITHWSVRHLAYTSRSSGGPKLKEDPFA